MNDRAWMDASILQTFNQCWRAVLPGKLQFQTRNADATQQTAALAQNNWRNFVLNTSSKTTP